MTPDHWGLFTLALYLAILAIVIVRLAVCCDGGPVVWLLYAAERIYIPLMFHWRSDRRCPFPQQGPAIIVANHRSSIDPLLLWMNHHLSGPRRRIRPIHFIMASQFANLRGVQWILRAMRVITVDREGRDAASVREAYRRLRQGHLLGIFPEGRINVAERLLPGTPGVAWLALKSQAPVYPVFIHDAPTGRNLVEPFRTPGRVRLTFGDRVDLSEFESRKTSDELLQTATGVLMRAIAALGGVELDECMPEDAPA